MVCDLGCEVVDTEPDLTGAEYAFLTWRAWSFDARLGAHLDTHRELVGPNVACNIEQGRVLTGSDLAAAEQAHTAAYDRVRRFMRSHDFVLVPVAQVPPFPFTTDHPLEIAGVEMRSYIDWMRSCWLISAVGLPAISVPCGLLPRGSRSDCRSSGAIATSWAYSSSRMRSSWPPCTGADTPRRPVGVSAAGWRSRCGGRS